jgi:hypothetical protein
MLAFPVSRVRILAFRGKSGVPERRTKRRRFRMIRKGLPMALALLVLLPASLVAQDPNTGPPDVLIKLVPDGEGRKLVVGPRGVGLCHNSTVCGTFMTFMWVGANNEGEMLEVTFTTDGVSDCLDPTTLTLNGVGAQYKKVVTVKPTCTGKNAFFYEIECKGGKDDNCGGVPKVDPGAIVEGSSGG